MEARKVAAANGWLWIKQGYGLFKKSPVLWVILAAIGLLGMLAISHIPVVGNPLVTLLFPVLLGGFMLGCRALEQGEELELAHLFAGFQHNMQQLLTLGGINLVGQLLILGLMMLTGGATLVGIMTSAEPVTDPEILMQAVAGAGAALLLGTTLSLLLLMAMQLAPMLIIFDKLSPVPALKASLRAFWRNIMPLTVYSLLLLPLAILASLPMMLGWLILLPVIITSMYVAYRDLFPAQQTGAENISPPKENPDAPLDKSNLENKKVQVEEIVKDAAYYCMILDIPLDGSEDVIRKAYKEQMQKHHPGRVAHLGQELQELAEHKILEIQEALANLIKLKSEGRL